jgi:hypothetical protein
VIKTWLQLQKSGVMIKENSRNLQRKKERNQMGKGACCKVLFSLFDVVKIMSFMMIQPPSPAFNLILQFNPSF